MIHQSKQSKKSQPQLPRFIQRSTGLLFIVLFIFSALASAGNKTTINSLNLDDKNGISVTNGYVRATIPGTNLSAIYMTINNSSAETKILTSINSQISPRIEMHEHTMANGMMRMRQIAHIEIAAKSHTVLQPSGLHLMVFNLPQPLMPKTQVQLTLNFNNGDSEVITLPVEKINPHRHHH